MSTTMAKTQTLIYRRTTLLEKLGPRAIGWKAAPLSRWRKP